jgi:hypothetical protein
MDELLLISSLGIVSTARSPQLKSSGIVSTARSPQLKSSGIVSTARNPQLKSFGAAVEEAGYSLITYQIN